MAPSVSPISKALLVPTAWEAVPRETPLAIGWLIFKTLNTVGPTTAPIIPERTMARTVIDEVPPKLLVISIPIGVVTLFDNKETVKLLSNPKKSDMETTDNTLTKLPTKIPVNIGKKFFLSSGKFLYSGTAKTIVAGPKKILINCPPLLYVSKSILNNFKNPIISMAAIKSGLKSGNFVFL